MWPTCQGQTWCPEDPRACAPRLQDNTLARSGSSLPPAEPRTLTEPVSLLDTAAHTSATTVALIEEEFVFNTFSSTLMMIGFS